MAPAVVRIAFLLVGISIIGCGGEAAKGPTLIPVSKCGDPFTVCGGDEVGSRSLTSLCADGSIDDFLNRGFANTCPSCGQTFADSTMASTGTVTYDGSHYTRTGLNQTTSRVKITAACLAEQIPRLQLTANSCNNLAKMLPGMYPNTTFNCAYDGNTCNCDMNSSQSLDSTGAYSILDGSTIIENGTNNANYGYCVNGSQMRQKADFVAVGITGVALLAKQ